MNSSLKKQSQILDPKQHHQFCNSLLSAWENIPFPTEKHESYRKFPIGALDWNELGFNPKEKKILEDVDLSDNLTEDLPPSFVLPILSLVKEYFPNDYFAYSSLCHSSEIEFVICENGMTRKEITQVGDSAKSLVRIFYIPSGINSQIKLKTVSNHETESLHLQTVLDVFVTEKEAQVEILDEENYDEDLIQFRTVILFSKENTSVKYHHFPFGGFRSKFLLHSHLLGKGAEVSVDGVSALGKRNLKDLDMEMHHHADHTTSKISYKAIVTDKSHHIFTGNLIIPPNLKKVVAHQESFNLSLNKKARAEANPKLEVLAEDVSCTHGATVGDIDEEQYFYLLSRGLNPEESKSLLVTAFYGETIQSIGFSDEIKQELESSIHNILVGGK